MVENIHILTTGGTIATDTAHAANGPSKKGEELLDEIPVSLPVSNIRVTQVMEKDSNRMTPSDAFQLYQHVTDVAKNEADGIIVTHGTDTMDEIAYYLDIVHNMGCPVIFTGAQRFYDQIDYDGISNLHDAICYVTNDRVRNNPAVYISFDKELHAARDAVKNHTSKLNAFESPGNGRIALMTPSGIRFQRELGSRSITLPNEEPSAHVEILKSGIGNCGMMIDYAVENNVDGLIVEGCGPGDTNSYLASGIEKALEQGIPVVLTSRCNEGIVRKIIAGGTGTTKELLEYGAINGDDLPSHKARVKLLLALSSTSDIDDIREIFEGDKS